MPHDVKKTDKVMSFSTFCIHVAAKGDPNQCNTKCILNL